jgi:hypothetical protein
MSTKISTIAASSTARKVVGSLGVIGAAAAVAGMGTFGTFTDSTAPVTTTITSGKVDINLASVGAPIPVTTDKFVPGDKLTRAVTLSNDGTSPLASVALKSEVTGTADVLTNDRTNGLKLTVEACSVPWTQGGAADAPTYTCTGGTIRTVVPQAPAASNVTLTDPLSLAVGGKDYLTFTISLPTSADNSFQGKSASLSLTFEGTQRTGTAR